MGVLDHGMIEFATSHKLDVLAGVQRFVRFDVAVGTYEGDLEAWIRFLDLANQLDVALEADRGSKQHKEFVVLADFNGLLPIDFGRRSVEQAAARDHTRRVGEPNGIPIGFNFAGSRPPRNGSAVKILKAWRIQKQCLHHIRHSAPSVFRKSSWIQAKSRRKGGNQTGL